MGEPIRVAIIAPEGLAIPPVNGGSVQIYLFHLLTSLSRFNSSDVLPTLLSPSTRNAQALPFTIKKIQHHHKNAYLKEIKYRLRSINADIIQVDNRPSWVPIIKDIKPKVPIILNLHSLTFLGKSHISPHRLQLVWGQIAAVVVNSYALAKVLQKRYHVPPKKIHVIYPGVDLVQFPSRSSDTGSSRRESFRRRFNCGQSFVFLYTGRVIRSKGVHLILEAFQKIHKKNRNTQLFIVGNTHPWEKQYRKTLQRQIRTHAVRLIKHVPHGKLVDYYLGADAFLCPSQQFEAFGLVNVEALATGLPVIGSKQGGIAEIVTNESGKLVVSYRSEKAFRMAMLDAIQNHKQWREERSDNARRRAESIFSWKRTASGFSQLYLLLAQRNLNSGN